VLNEERYHVVFPPKNQERVVPSTLGGSFLVASDLSKHGMHSQGSLIISYFSRMGWNWN
jgi:hypothetical protein